MEQHSIDPSIDDCILNLCGNIIRQAIDDWIHMELVLKVDKLRPKWTPRSKRHRETIIHDGESAKRWIFETGLIPLSQFIEELQLELNAGYIRQFALKELKRVLREERKLK